LRCCQCHAGISAPTVGTVFKGQYRVVELLQRDADSARFAVEDIKTGKRCWLHEFFPQVSQKNEQATSWMRQAYVTQGRLLNGELPGTPRVAIFNHEQRFYAVEEAVEGRSVAELRQAKSKPDEQELRRILRSLLE